MSHRELLGGARISNKKIGLNPVLQQENTSNHLYDNHRDNNSEGRARDRAMQNY